MNLNDNVLEPISIGELIETVVSNHGTDASMLDISNTFYELIKFKKNFNLELAKQILESLKEYK